MKMWLKTIESDLWAICSRALERKEIVKSAFFRREKTGRFFISKSVKRAGAMKSACHGESIRKREECGHASGGSSRSIN